MKRFVSLALALTLILATLVCLPSCADNNDEIKVCATALAIGNRANSASISFDSQDGNSNLVQAITDRIRNTFYSYGSVYAVKIDGSPSIVLSADLSPTQLKSNDTKREQRAEISTHDFLEALKSKSAALVPEADVLKAIRLSADCLRGMNAESRQLIIVDSGLQTTGDLSFVSYNYFESDPDKVTENLSAIHALPDLSGIEVVWYGLGYVADEQPELNSSYSYALTELWATILNASGAVSVEISPTPVNTSTTRDISKFPHVTPVAVPSSEGVGGGGYLRCDVHFEPNSAILLDVDEAREVIEEVLIEMNTNPTMSITLAGSCASIGDGATLSLARAQAIKNIITDNGVSSSRVETVGLGRSQTCELRVNDLDKDGNLIESEAKKNRTVFIYASGSKLAERVRNSQAQEEGGWAA